MKIFVGGMKPHHQKNLADAFPEVDFTFAKFDDTCSRWISRAAHADVVIVDQARCEHSIVDALRSRHLRVYTIDGKLLIRQMIERITRGQQAQAKYVAYTPFVPA